MDVGGCRVSWPSHGPRGRHDWWTYLERGYADPFRDAVREMPDVVDAPFDENGRTMLMYAVSNSLEIVNILIKAGADVNRCDSYARPVWDFAPTWGPSSVEIWRALIQAGLDVNSRGAKNETPLMRVCSGYVDPATSRSFLQSRCSIVQLLLDAGAEVNAVDQYGGSPLQMAAGAGNTEVVKVLLKAGANPNMVDASGRCPLYEASLHGRARIVQALLQAGAHVEAATLGSRIRSLPVFTSGLIDVEGVTPLIAAAEGGHFHAVRLLVDAGADVSRSDSSGFTPLMGAARAGHPQMVQFLLERGAHHDAVDASGKTAQTHAAEFQHQHEVAPILKRARSKADPV